MSSARRGCPTKQSNRHPLGRHRSLLFGNGTTNSVRMPAKFGERITNPQELALSVDVKYQAEGTAWGGREGHAASSDGRLDLQLSIPKELGGGGQGTNPEQLFAVGYSACFHSALKLTASKEHVDVSESAVTVRVGIGPNDAGDGFAFAGRDRWRATWGPS